MGMGKKDGSAISSNNNYILSCDIGQVNDFTALSVLELIPAPATVNAEEISYHLPHLERLPLQTPYPKIVDKIAERFLAVKALDKHAQLVIDATGVGRPVVDMLVLKGLNPIAITITGGQQVYRESPTWYRVPKKDLITAAQITMQNRLLKVARSLPEAAVLLKELENFRYKINLETANMQMEAWRDGQHDDLVLSVACGLWWAIQSWAAFGILNHYKKRAEALTVKEKERTEINK